MLLLYHAACFSSPLSPECLQATGLSSHPLHIQISIFLRALLIFPFCYVSLESDHRLMAWPVLCLEVTESPLSFRGQVGEISEEFGSHFSFPCS